jgi:hypothetical protein
MDARGAEAAMLDLRVVIAACVASIGILVLGIGLLVSFRAAREPTDSLVQNVRIRESPRVVPSASRAALPAPVIVPTQPASLPAAEPSAPVVVPALSPEPLAAAAPEPEARNAVSAPVAAPAIETAAPAEVVTTGALPEQPAEPAAVPVPESRPAISALPKEKTATNQKSLRRRTRAEPPPAADPFSAFFSVFQQPPAQPR